MQFRFDGLLLIVQSSGLQIWIQGKILLLPGIAFNFSMTGHTKPGTPSLSS